MKKITYFILCNLPIFNNIIFIPAAYPLDIISDGSTNTKVYDSSNGTPTIDIAKPNGRGVSLNRYDDYNVDQRNLVINNSTVPIISKFAGALDRNSNFNNGEATIIVNEVTSDRITELDGYTEIAGKKAELIIANPNGIITKNAGFLNTSRLGLIVGRNIDIDRLEFEIDRRNELTISDPLDLIDLDYATLIARIVKLQKEITANTLVIQTGNDRVKRLDTGEYEVTSIKQDNNKPTLSVDASVFGNIQAGKIYIISTEDGVGVKTDSNLTTNIDDIVFDIKGDIQINKDIIAEQNVKISTTEKLTNRGNIIAKNNNIEMEVYNMDNDSSLIYANKNISMTVTDTIDNNNNALIYSKSGNMSITAKQLNNRQTSNIQTANGNIKLNVDILNNLGTRDQEIKEGAAYSISRYNDYRNKRRAEYYRNNLFWFNNHYNEYSDPNPNAREDIVTVYLTHTPSNIIANGNIEIIANTVANRDSNLTASGDIIITADTLDNSRESFVVGGLLKETQWEEYHWEYPFGFGWLKVFGEKVWETKYGEAPIPPQTHFSHTPSLISAGGNVRLNIKNKLGQDEDIKNKSNYSPIERNLPNLNTNHFVIKSRDPSSMFETRPEFLDLSIFEARAKYRKAITTLIEDIMILGDAQVENEYIRSQIELQKEKIKTVTADQNELNRRIEELIDNGIKFAKLHQEQISYKLTEQQLKELNKDIIHYERRIIDGNEVLVPIIYYASIDRALASSIEANANLEIIGTAEITNSGKLKGKNITINTTGNIVNRAGTIQSNNDITIKAKNIANTSITNKYQNGNNITEELVEQGTIQSNKGDINLESDNDIVNLGSTIYAAKTLKLTAGNSISIVTQQIHNKIDQGDRHKKETLTNAASNIFANDLIIKSSKDTLIKGSNLNVTNNATIDTNNLIISSVENISNEYSKTEKYSFWKGSKTTTTESTSIINSKSNLNIGDNLIINTKQNTNIIGSNLNVTNDITIAAGDNVNILNVRDRSETIATIEKTGGALSSLLSIAVGAITSVGVTAITGGTASTMVISGAIGAISNINNITSKTKRRIDIDETIVSSNINSNRLTINNRVKDINIRSSIIAEDTKVIDEKLNNIYNDRKEEHLHYGEVIEERNSIETIGNAMLRGTTSGIATAGISHLLKKGIIQKISESLVGSTVKTLEDFNKKPLEERKYQSNSQKDLRDILDRYQQMVEEDDRIINKRLGSLSEQYESGGKGSETINAQFNLVTNNYEPKDKTDRGGLSYGVWQIATRTGTMNEYMKFLVENNYQEIHDRLENVGGVESATDGKKEFIDTWREIAREEPDLFRKTQYEFIKKTHYDRAVKDINKTYRDFNPEEKSKTIRDVIWSIAVQHGAGGATNIINEVLRENQSLTDEQLIDRMYERRTKYIEDKGTEKDKNGPIHRRYIRERQKALEMLRNEQQKE